MTPTRPPHAPSHAPAWREFVDRRRVGMIFALDGGLWLHRHLWRGERMAHLVSADRDALLAAGKVLELRAEWLQYKPLRDPRTGQRVDAWHWDLRGTHVTKAIALAQGPSPRIGDER